MILPKRGCGTRVTVRTTIVLFMLLEITWPVRVLRELRVTEAGSGGGVATDCRSSSAIKFILSPSVWIDASTQFRFAQHRALPNASGSAVPAARSAVAIADANFPVASRVFWLTTHPYSSRLFPSSSWLGRLHVMARQKLCPHRQLIGRQSKRFPRDRFGNTIT